MQCDTFSSLGERRMDFSVLSWLAFGQFLVICLVCVISGSCIFNTADPCILSSEAPWFSGMLNTGLLHRESCTALLVLKIRCFVEMVKLLRLVVLYFEL